MIVAVPSKLKALIETFDGGPINLGRCELILGAAVRLWSS
jgi:hypothetical protein